MPLTVAELQTLDRLLREALELPLPARAAWIDSLPSPHDTLAPLLRAYLLDSDDPEGIETADFLGALPAYTNLPARDNDPAIGERVGPYKLVRQLGEGGMSSVWLAERVDGTLRREVALKLPHRHLLDRGLAARMQRERDILAGLNDDHIARLYDAGVDTEGRPWLALEYVAGVQINTFCTDAKVHLNGRVRLMVQAVRAVAHAHASLVVHRDLKPSNILVTTGEAVPRVKLLDFGIAKLLAHDERAPDLTQTLGRALTPDYASPEQLLEQPVTTSSDIYSLGVVLYEVVTGEKPYKLKHQSAQALAEAVIHADVMRPGKRSAGSAYANDARRIDGDLDAIILKALKAVPAERYATASALADDLERFLAKQPVLAQPDSLSYRTRRFLQRHALASSAAAAVSIALIVGIGLALWQAREARLETAKTKAVKDFLLSIITVGNVDQQDALMRRKQPIGDVLLDAAKSMPGRFADQPEVRSELQGLLGTALADLNLQDSARVMRESRVAELKTRGASLVERMQAQVDLAMTLSAGTEAKRGMKLLNEVISTLDKSTDRQERLVLAEALRATAVSKMLRIDGSVDGLRDAERALSIVETLEPGSKTHATALSTLGIAHGHNRDLPKAELAFGKAIAISKTLPPSDRAYEAIVQLRYAEILNARRYHQRALQQFSEALAIIEQTNGRDSFRWAYTAVVMANLVSVLGDSPKAFVLFEQILKVYTQMGKELSPGHMSVAEALYGGALVEYGRFSDAVEMTNRAYAPYRDENSKFYAGSSHWTVATRYARVMQAVGNYAEAEKVLNQALKTIRERKVSRAYSDMTHGERLLAINYLYRGEFSKAESLLKEIIDVDGTPKERVISQRNLSHLWLARTYLEQRKLPDAEIEIATMAKILDNVGEDEIAISRRMAAQLADLNGLLAMKRGDAIGAIPHYRRAVDLITPLSDPASPLLASARADLALALARNGERAQAMALAQQARDAFAQHPGVAPHLRQSLIAADKLLGRS